MSVYRAIFSLFYNILSATTNRHSINSQSAMVKRNARESRGSPKDRELKGKQKTVGLQRGNKQKFGRCP